MYNPFISLIMPLRNEEAFIERGLSSVLEQDYPADRMEILIADGMSSDDTRERILKILDGRFMSVSRPRSTVIILDNIVKIVPAGLNIALRQAKGEIIIRVDGHTVVSPDYVHQCVQALQRTHADNVGGRMNAVGINSFGKVVALATSTPFGIGSGRFHYSDKEEWVDTVYLGTWPRRVFEEIGLFDEELVRDQDDEFNFRLREHGGRILLCSAIKSNYTVRSTPAALWKQYYQYGFWKVRVLQKHPRQMSLRQFMPPAFVLALLLSLLLALFALLRPMVYQFSAIIPLLYLLANLLASLCTASQRGWKYLFLLPFIYAILHLSYGSGFFVGVFKFAERWGDRAGIVPPLHPISG